MPDVSPQLYVGDGHFFDWSMGNYQPIENIEKSSYNSKMKWVLRYNFNRTDGKTPSGDDYRLIWEDFWGETYDAQMVKLSKESSDIELDNQLFKVTT